MPVVPSRARIRLAELRLSSSNRLEALVLAGGRRQLLWFEADTDAIPLEETADAFLPILVPAAMAAGLPLRFEAPLSAAVLAAARRVSGVLASWHPRWAELSLDAAGPPGPAAMGAGNRPQAAFFSGGLDSFRTLQRHRDQLAHLLFVHGLDIPLAEQDKADLVRGALLRVAAEAGPSLLTVRTNLRAFTDRWVSWELHQCGSALAAVALLLAPRLSRVLIPSSYPLAFLHPYGSHPGLEPLWSTPGLELRHDTLREDRLQKAQALASWPLARCQLRVCWQPRTPELNCGRCRKCLTTLAVLRGVCGDQDWPTFPERLDLQALALVQTNSPAMLCRFFLLRDHLTSTGRDPPLLAAVNQLLRRQRRRDWGRTLHHRLVRVRARLHP